MSLRTGARARPLRVRRGLGRLGLMLCVAGGGVAGLAFLSPTADALAICGGNNNIVVSPYTCTKSRVIDGTTFTVVLDVHGGVATAHYTLDAPRTTDTPIRV